MRLRLDLDRCQRLRGVDPAPMLLNPCEASPLPRGKAPQGRAVASGAASLLSRPRCTDTLRAGAAAAGVVPALRPARGSEAAARGVVGERGDFRADRVIEHGFHPGATAHLAGLVQGT